MRLMAFWWDRRGQRRFPTLEDFDPEVLAVDWPNCFTLLPGNPLGKSLFNYIGAEIAKTSGVGEDMITLDQLTKDSLLDHATRNIKEVLEQKVPIVASGEFVDPRGRVVVFRGLLLPLSSDQINVDCLVGGARCKVKKPA